MKKVVIVCLLAAAVSMAQKQRVVVLPAIADPETKLNARELDILTEKVRGYATDVLPLGNFMLLKQDYVKEKLGDEALFEACKGGTCIGDLIAMVQADFGARCDVFSVKGKLWLKFELYGTLKGDDEAGTISTFSEEVKDFKAMEAVIKKRVPDAFRKILPEIAPPSSAAAGGTRGGVLTDSRDGKKYRIVKIGSQTWMAQNLNYNASGSRCYDNNPGNCAKYGRLYNWNTAKNACPSGWHLPSKGEYEALDKAVGGSTVAGKKLKATSGWKDNGNGTDDYGFSALPGGSGGSGGSFGSVGDFGDWWSASEESSDYAYYRVMYYNREYAFWLYSIKSGLFCVRCLQD